MFRQKKNNLKGAGIGVLIVSVTAAGGLLAALPSAQAQAAATKPSASIAAGPQYDTTHVYVQNGMASAS